MGHRDRALAGSAWASCHLPASDLFASAPRTNNPLAPLLLLAVSIINILNLLPEYGVISVGAQVVFGRAGAEAGVARLVSRLK